MATKMYYDLREIHLLNGMTKYIMDFVAKYPYDQ